MAFRHGRLAEVTVNGTALSVYCDTADLNIDIDSAETTTLTKTWKTHIPGTAGADLTLAGNYDPTAVSGPAVVLEALIGAAAFAVVVEPGGNASGQRRRTFNAILTNYSESSPVGDKVTFSATLLADGAITFAAI